MSTDKPPIMIVDPNQEQRFARFEQDIITEKKVSFTDVAGLDQVKKNLMEIITLFFGSLELSEIICKNYSSILLYGLPGVGKTYLARALAAECNVTFISINSSNFISRWLGDSERDMKYLFEFARTRQPSIIFMDDIDTLCTEYREGEFESSRRVMTEFLIQMHNVVTDTLKILILAACNRPWELSPAVHRQFTKGFYIPLPDLVARSAIFNRYFNDGISHVIEDHQWAELAEKTDNYSCADIVCICREAAMVSIKSIVSATYFKRVRSIDGKTELWAPCSSDEEGAISLKIDEINDNELYQKPMTMEDVITVLNTHRLSWTKSEILRMEEYNRIRVEENA